MLGAVQLLVIEDEILFRNVLEEGLADEGFNLVLKSNGQAALDELEANAASFQLVVTDIKLGEGPSGWDVGRRVRELVSNMPVVYMSGDSAAEWASKGVPDSVMIAKPFVVAQIVTAIAALLNTSNVHGVK